MSNLSDITLIAADWGTSNLRIWGIDHRGQVIDTINNGKGMSSLIPSELDPSKFRESKFAWMFN